MRFVDSVVEIDGEPYVLWFCQDEYKLYDCINATPLKDWKRLQKEYEDDMEYYCQFGNIAILDYDYLKENIEEDLEE